MKKFLLTLAAVATMVVPTMAEEMSIVFGDEGLTSGVPITSFEKAPISMTFDTGTGTRNPQTITSSSLVIPAVYTGNVFTISVPSNYTIKTIVFTSTGYSYNFASSKFSSISTGKITTTSTTNVAQTWEAVEDVTNNITFVMKGTGYFKQLDITYEEIDLSMKFAEMSFPQEDYSALFGYDFIAPVLTKATDAAPVYSSSNENVATVDPETGAVTLVGTGTTVITAKCERTEEYFGGVAEYNLEVTRSNAAAAGKYYFEVSQMNRDIPTSGTGVAGGTISADGVTFSFERASAYSTRPSYDAATKDMRLWGNNKMTVSVPEGYILINIVFHMSEMGLQRQATLTCNDGEVVAQVKDAPRVMWYGMTNEVTFTLNNANDFGNASGGAAFCFDAVTVEYDFNTAVNEIEAGNGEAKYFDLNGREVKGQPVSGLYIKVVDGKASKVIVK